MEAWLLPFGPSTSVDTSSLCPRFDVLGETFFLGIGNDNQLFFLGTLAPFLRASESPIAIACLRLLTFPPRPPLPERRVPFFFRCMALFTLFPAALPYLRLDPFFLVVGISEFLRQKLRGKLRIRGLPNRPPIADFSVQFAEFNRLVCTEINCQES